MIERYTRPEMKSVWTDEARFGFLLQVEIAVAQAEADLGIIPLKAAQDIAKKSKINVPRIREIEATTKHDIIAFVSQVAETVGPNGRFLHFGLTSSDVLDSATSLQVQEAYHKVLAPNLKKLEATLFNLMKTHRSTLCAGRTHGMHAEPTTFGLVMASYYEEFRRRHARIEATIADFARVKLSGAVGTYSGLSAEVEARVGKILKLQPEVIATQVVPRDRHAAIFVAFAEWASSLERLSMELRHLQRTEVGEAEEGFEKGQKGSSAMPHKRNPISAENLTGLSRLIRSYALPALENVALWHERDISHSSVERVIFPDAFILMDYASDRMARVLSKLIVYPDRMRANMDLSRGQMMSSHLLLLLVEKGWTREEAYKLVQEISHGLKAGESLQDKILMHPEIVKKVKASEVKKVMSGARHLEACEKLMDRWLKKGKTR